MAVSVASLSAPIAVLRNAVRIVPERPIASPGQNSVDSYRSTFAQRAVSIVAYITARLRPVASRTALPC